MWWFRKTNVFKEEIHESAIREKYCLYIYMLAYYWNPLTPSKVWVTEI